MMRRYHILYATLLCGALLLAGCKNALPTDEILSGGYDPSRVAPVTLSQVKLTTDADTRATSSESPMNIGETFRLYALPKGDTSLDNLIATRTYTIANEAGVPELDAGQKPLYLPVGEVDIVLVGPVRVDQNAGLLDENDVPYPPIWEEIATENEVLPQYGVDLVSSRTTIQVKTGANQFQTTPLRHRMAKMEVIVERPADATYVNLQVTKIRISNQTRTGKFVFDQAGGSITPQDEGTEALEPNVIADDKNQRYRSTIYTIPRNNAQLRIGVFFTCNLPGSHNLIDNRLESGIMTTSLAAGQMNRFITKPHISTELLFRTRLMPWDDIYLADAENSSTRGQLFNYSGQDAPITIDGKQYWPDRSGNGNHALLVGDMRYDAAKKCYYAAAKGAYLSIPDLGDMPTYTLELTAESAYENRNCAAYCRNAAGTVRYIQVHLPATNNLIVYEEKNGTILYSMGYTPFANDKGYLQNLATYAFTKDLKVAYMHRNGVELMKKDITANYQVYQWNDLRLAYWPETSVDNGWFIRDISQFKLYAARLTREPLTTDEMKNNYRNDMTNYAGFDVNKDITKQDYVKSGLILDLRADAANTITVNNTTCWKDQSGMGNHAMIYGATYTAASKWYSFSGSSNYMKLLNSLGTYQNLTVELVVQASTSNTTVLNFSANPLGSDGNREFHIHTLWDSKFTVNSPSSNGRTRSQIQKLADDCSYNKATQTSKLNQWSITRRDNDPVDGLVARLNGIVEGSASTSDTYLKEMRYCFIGCQSSSNTPQWFNGKIAAIRVYNRVLTPYEQQVNYLVDKRIYTLVP